MFAPRARFTEDELDRWADEAVRVFRAAYVRDAWRERCETTLTVVPLGALDRHD